MAVEAGGKQSGATTAAVGRAVAVLSMGNVIAPTASLVTAPIIAHALGVNGRGQLAAATVPLLFFVSFATLGLPDVATHFTARNAHRAWHLARQLLLIAMLVGILSTFIIWLLAEPLSGGSQMVKSNIQLAGLAVAPQLALAVFRGSAAGLNRWRNIRYEQAMTGGISLVAVCVLAAIGHLTIRSCVIVAAAAPLFAGIAYLNTFRALSQGPAVLDNSASARKMSRFAALTWLGSIAGITLARLDQLLLNPLSGSRQLGLYVVAVACGELPIVITAAVASVIFATESGSPDDERLARSARVGFAVMVCFCVIEAAALPVLVPLVFGTGFRAAIPVSLILLGNVLVTFPGSFAGSAVAARGRPGIRSAALAAGAITNVVTLLLLAPAFGANGAAFAMVAGSLVGAGVLIIALRRTSGIRLRSLVCIRKAEAAYVVRAGYRIMRQRKSTEL